MECQLVGFPPARVQNRSSHGGCCWHTAQVLPSHSSPFPVSDVSDEGNIDDTSDKKKKFAAGLSMTDIGGKPRWR